MPTYAKAIVGAATAGLGSLVTALVDNSVTLAEGAAALLAALVAFGAVYGVRNGTSEV